MNKEEILNYLKEKLDGIQKKPPRWEDYPGSHEPYNEYTEACARYEAEDQILNEIISYLENGR